MSGESDSSKKSGVSEKVDKKVSGGKKSESGSELKEAFGFGVDYFSSIVREYPWAVPLFCVIFLLGFAFFVTTLNFDLSFADDLAAQNVDDIIFSNIFAGLSEKYPNLDSGILQSRALGELQEVKESGVFNGVPVDLIVAERVSVFREAFVDDDGVRYPLTIDAYFWLNLMENRVEDGRFGDFVVNDTEFIATLAPNGLEVGDDLLYPSLIVFVSGVLGLDFVSVAYFYPVIVSMLVAVFAFFATRRIGGSLAGLFAGVLVVLLPAISRDVLFLQVDTDALVLFFGVLLSWLFIEVVYCRSLKRSLLLSGFAGLCVGLFSGVWTGWFFVFDLILVCFLFAVLYLFFLKCGFYKSLVFNRKVFFGSLRSSFKVLRLSVLFDVFVVKRFLLSFVVFFVFSLIFVSLFSGFGSFVSAFVAPLSSSSVFDVPFVDDGLWPNVFTTVAELGDGSVASAVSSVGGWFVLLLTFSGLLVYLLGGVSSVSRRFKFGLFVFSFVFWVLGLLLGFFVSVSVLLVFLCFFIPFLIGLKVVGLRGGDVHRVISGFFLLFVLMGALYSAFVAVRFGLFVSFAFVVPFGVAVASLFSLFVGFVRSLGVSLLFCRLFVFFCFVLVFFLPLPFSLFGAAHDSVDRSFPLVGDSLHDSMNFVRGSTSEDGIVTSWWDFGHPFRFVSDRGVTFDGASQTSPQAHWVGKLLLSSSDEEGLGVLRMLNCGGNSAFDRVVELRGDDSVVGFVLAKRVVDEVVSLDVVSAREFLISEGFGSSEVEEVLGFTHCSAPDGVLVVSGDMVGKSAVWGHFGLWDFDKVAFWKSGGDELVVSSLGLDDVGSSWGSEVELLSSNRLLDSWFAPFPQIVGVPGFCSDSGSVLSCSVSSGVGSFEFSVSYDDKKGVLSGVGVSSVVFSDGVSVRSVSSGVGSGVSFVVVPSSSGFDVFVSGSEVLVDSLFVRLYFFDGLGVEESFVRVFDSGFDVFGQRFVVYRAVW